jgi:cobalt/nickel transport system permease protein
VNRRLALFVVAGLAVALVLAVAVSRLASSQPDGLERVAADHGLDSGATEHALADGPLADYSAPGVDDPGVAKGAAGVVGVAVTFLVAAGAAWAARSVSARRRRRPEPASTA